MPIGPKSIIGMLHAGALPGTPRSSQSLGAIIETILAEADVYHRAGLDGLLLENMHDLPYLNGAVGPEIVAAMTAIGSAVRTHCPLPLGVQILAAAGRESLAVAYAIGATFIRVENYCYAHVADEGLMPNAAAGPLLRFRRQIGADAIKVFADVKKKHSSHAVTADVTLAEAATTAEFFGADGIIVTGLATGQPTAVQDVQAVRAAVDRAAVCIGSGLNPDNLSNLWPHADVFIVGSYFKRDGVWSEAVDVDRVDRFMRTVKELRRARSE